MKKEISPKEAFQDICSMPDLSQKIVESGSENPDLSEYLLANNYFRNPNRSITTLKVVGKHTNLPQHKLRKSILSFHSRLIELMEDDKGRVEYHLSHRGRYMRIGLQGFPNLPRIGETVIVYYFSNYMRTSRYFAKHIEHELSNGEYVISVELEGGSYNAWWEIRKDEALAKEEISIDDYYFGDDWDLMAELRISPYWSRINDERRNMHPGRPKIRRKNYY
jgi:hypothetical protein